MQIYIIYGSVLKPLHCFNVLKKKKFDPPPFSHAAAPLYPLSENGYFVVTISSEQQLVVLCSRQDQGVNCNSSLSLRVKSLTHKHKHLF